jgi:hypothetical protein
MLCLRMGSRHQIAKPGVRKKHLQPSILVVARIKSVPRRGPRKFSPAKPVHSDQRHNRFGKSDSWICAHESVSLDSLLIDSESKPCTGLCPNTGHPSIPGVHEIPLPFVFGPPRLRGTSARHKCHKSRTQLFLLLVVQKANGRLAIRVSAC